MQFGSIDAIAYLNLYDDRTAYTAAILYRFNTTPFYIAHCYGNSVIFCVIFNVIFIIKTLPCFINLRF